MFKSLTLFLLGASLLPAQVSSSPGLLMAGGQTVLGARNYCGVDSGAVNLLVCNNPTGEKLSVYVVGNSYSIQPGHTNTAAVTLSIDGLTAYPVKKLLGTAVLASGDIVAGSLITVTFDASNVFELQSPIATTSSGGTVTTFSATVPSWLAQAVTNPTTTPALAITPATGQTANQFLAAPNGSSGALSVRAIVAPDLPNPLVATGIVDGTAPVTVTTGISATLGGGTYRSGYTFNQEATPAAAVTYTLPVAAAGRQFCIANSYNGTAADNGALALQTSGTGQFIVFTDGTLSASGGYVISGGAVRDSACAVGIDATHWMLYVSSGSWSKF